MRRNAGSGSTSRLFMRLDQPFDLLAQLRLRQRDDDEVLAQLRRRHRLAVADDVVRGRNNLALLLRERVDLHVAAAATAAAATAHRHRRAELLVELADADEVEIARDIPADVVGRAREVRDRVARARPSALRDRTCARPRFPAAPCRVASMSFFVCSGPPLTEYTSSSCRTPKSSSARASIANSSMGDAVVSRPGFAIDTVGAWSSSTSIVYCGDALTSLFSGPPCSSTR